VPPRELGLRIYLLTPFELSYMVDASISRLLVQLWPMGVLAFCLLLRGPEQAGSTTAEKQDPVSIGSNHGRKSDRTDRGVVLADP
jgi:hypothetical protein